MVDSAEGCQFDRDQTPPDYKNKEYFHGFLARDDVEQLLEQEGDFILRITEPCVTKDCSEPKPPPAEPVISVRWEGAVRHFIIQHKNTKYFVEPNKLFDHISELIEYYYKSGAQMRGSACIKNPIAHAQWELAHEQITLGKQLGSGEFGDVHIGTLQETKGDPPTVYNREVAVKISRQMSPKQRRLFMAEARLMRLYDHVNIVKMIGVAAQKEPLMLLLELAKGGCLKEYLVKNKDKIEPKERLKFCLDAAKGMEYLESKRCIHRDLAVRNCLLGEDLTVKISDFGLSKDTESYQMSEGNKKVPVRWLAPESITRKIFNRQTDVWTFGIVMWEIYMNAAQPYPEIRNAQEVLKKVGKYRYHMKPPESMPPLVAQLLLKCWNSIPELRPTFQQIRQDLETAMEKTEQVPDSTQEQSKNSKDTVNSAMAALTQKTSHAPLNKQVTNSAKSVAEKTQTKSTMQILPKTKTTEKTSSKQ